MKLFEEARLKDIRLRNRTVRSATYEGLASPNGCVTDAMLAFYRNLAAGGTALIIPGHIYVSPEGQAGPNQLSICDSSCFDGLKKLSGVIHEFGARCALQLAHCGLYGAYTDLVPVGPVTDDNIPKSHMLSEGEIADLVQKFAAAARHCKECGFDAVEVHCAHGYLLSQFISPAINTRSDGYGGDVYKRARFPIEVIEAIREAVGPGYPILAKLNTEDFLSEGLTPEDAVITAKLLSEAGLDAVELSGGTVISPIKRIPVRPGAIKTPAEEAFYRQASGQFKQALSIPVILTGGIRSREVADDLLASGACDFVGFCRPLVCEPHLIRRWENGDREKSKCISCNGCLNKVGTEGLCCQYLKKKNAAR